MKPEAAVDLLLVWISESDVHMGEQDGEGEYGAAGESAAAGC